jgi:hypothetical protein
MDFSAQSFDVRRNPEILTRVGVEVTVWTKMSAERDVDVNPKMVANGCRGDK